MSPREFDRLDMSDIHLLWSQLVKEQQAIEQSITGMPRG